MKMKEMFKEFYEARHEYAKEWKKKNGGKVMGYFCTYVPEEMLYAAGVLPVRILGSHEPQDLTEPHIFGMFCPFCRDCLAQGLKGRFDYLDGIMIAQSCLHVRQAYTSWDLHIPTEYSYYLSTPHHVQSPRAIPYLAGELEDFKKSLEGWLGKKMTDADLDKGIQIMNTNRSLLRELYELRKQEAPPLTGLDAMYAVVSGQMIDKVEHNRILEDTLKSLKNKHPERPTGTRLMLIGSEDDDTGFIEMVESLGATFVIDDHCTGSRYIWEDVKPNGDRLTAIAERYVKRVPCPTKDWPLRNRLPHILKLAKEYKVEGAIIVQQKFCDPHELDIPAIKKLLEENGIRTLFLELDVTVPIGQFKVRVEAFLEMLSEEDLF
ncbi:benzoyl-CoA reductase, bzd-type, subunit N [candidate division TA06 bacterium]|uniref:Benzoyl-CoA reductase, bzd-type, subunit N n=1 Tax=candidate division TA06 bacterium TaxID=2250710 RepID=A0A523XFL4_UNCT6|nr:MAG: benzoyl-CoA reductase, bzd-type, subunit N [candidate division TA06 bacterium]